MTSLKITLYVLTACFAVVNALNTSNFTCIGNPYFTAPYNPNPISPGTTSQTILSQWNVTYNSATGIYNFSNYTGLPACKQLVNTGSCCSPDLINQTVQAYIQLFNATNNATVTAFKNRVSRLQSYGQLFGKIMGTLVDLVSKVHEITFKLATNVNAILNDANTLNQLMTIYQNTGSNNILNSLSSGDIKDPNQVLSLAYQLINIVANKAGISSADIADLFGSIKAVEGVLGSLPINLLNRFSPFQSVDPALISNASSKWGSIFSELVQRSVNISITINIGNLAMKRFRILQASSITYPIPFPLILDARNIEAVAKALNDAVNNAQNATQFFTILLNNADTIYKTINNTWTSNIKSLNDVQFGGTWSNVKALIIKIGSFVFNDAVKRVVTVAENKKNCLSVVFRYQGYIGCLACDASALALGKIILNSASNTFSPVLSSTFGSYITGNCTDYVQDLIFMNSFLKSLKGFNSVYNINNLAKQNPTKIDSNVTIAPNSSNSSIDSSLNVSCSLNNTSCTWIQDNILDGNGPTLGLLCDYDSDDYDQGSISGLLAPQIKKASNSSQTQRILDDSTNSAGTVVYSSAINDEVSTTDVGFSTQPNYTVDNSSASSISVNSDTGDSTSALKRLVSIPLIVATVIAFLF